MPEMPGLRRWLEAGWYGSRARWVLQPPAFLYRLVLALRRRAFRSGLLASAHPGVPTIVVGNLTVGGTGKTPLVAWLAVRLRERGLKPGIVLRGYGGTVRGVQMVRPADTAEVVGDEALLLLRQTGCPVAVGAGRGAAARLLIDAGCDLVIADDGLQHLALRRDMEIIVLDGERGFGNGALLPAGPLREPIARARLAAFIVVHGADRHGAVPAGVASLRMDLECLPLRELASGREASIQGLAGQRVHAVAGIGHPQRFFTQLRRLGIDPIEHAFPDHHRYDQADLAFGDGLPIVMTEKDAVKCTGLAVGNDDVYYLPVAAVLAPGDAARLLDRVLAMGRV
jgi:tetraacyldisaccharide 4'-kinase